MKYINCNVLKFSQHSVIKMVGADSYVIGTNLRGPWFTMRQSLLPIYDEIFWPVCLHAAIAAAVLVFV